MGDDPPSRTRTREAGAGGKPGTEKAHARPQPHSLGEGLNHRGRSGAKPLPVGQVDQEASIYPAAPGQELLLLVSGPPGFVRRESQSPPTIAGISPRGRGLRTLIPRPPPGLSARHLWARGPGTGISMSPLWHRRMGSTGWAPARPDLRRRPVPWAEGGGPHKLWHGIHRTEKSLWTQGRDQEASVVRVEAGWGLNSES